MGSAQSARRIQPGGARPAVPVVPADLSRSPFLPTPPPARLSPPSPRPAVAVPAPPSGGVSAGAPAAGVGCGGGARAGPGVGSAGDRPPVGDRPPPGALPPWRCAATGSGTAGKARRGRWLGGGGVTRGRRTTPPRVLQPPGSSARRIPGPREPDTRRRALPPASPLPPLPVGWRKGWGSRGRAAPPTARPLSHPPSPPSSLSGVRGPGGRGGLSPVRPGRRRAVGPGGAVVTRSPPSSWGGGSEAERTGSAAMSATHPTRLVTRTKESNACASQGLVRKPPWRNEGEGPRSRGPRGGIPRPLQSAEGAPPARLARRAGEVEHERTR